MYFVLSSIYSVGDNYCMFQILNGIKCRDLQNETLFRLYIYTPVFWSADQILSWFRKREIKQKTLNFVVHAHFKNVPPK